MNYAKELDRIIKHCRKIMRKDSGLSSDIQRLPQLALILFLKWIDDWELRSKNFAIIKRRNYSPLVQKPFRWSDWINDSNLITGDSFIQFLNKELLPYMRNLSKNSKHNLALIISRIFNEFKIEMESGDLLRNVVLEISKIDFNVSDQIHSLAYIYETLLKELRDAAGSAGEFYTPRPVINFIVERINPKLGQKILDPACGTGGFLVESYKYLKNQLEKQNSSDFYLLNNNINGIEKKSLPYLLSLMNLILHNCNDPNLLSSMIHGNALIQNSNQIIADIDIIITNPPFGAEEEDYIVQNFPKKTQTKETALLFLQYIMKRLKPDGKCAIIVPNGFLVNKGTAKIIRQALIEKFNLHHIVVLPEGVFSPYTPIPTNILFFEKTGKTKTVRYIEIPGPRNSKQFSKTNPIHPTAFVDCVKTWNEKIDSENAWSVTLEQIIDKKYDLLPQNPEKIKFLHKSSFHDNYQRFNKKIIELEDTLKEINENITPLSEGEYEVSKFSNLLEDVSKFRKESVNPEKKYKFIGIRGEGKGLFRKEELEGSEISSPFCYRLENGDFIYNRLFAWKGSFGYVGSDFHDCYVSNEFPIFRPKKINLDAKYFLFYSLQPKFWVEVENESRGSTPGSRNRFYQNKLLDFNIAIPKGDFEGNADRSLTKLLKLRENLLNIKNDVNSLIDEFSKEMIKEFFKFSPLNK